MPPDLPAGAFGHCLAVLRQDDAAEKAATLAVRRGGRSHVAVLANARHEALRLASDVEPEVEYDTPPDDLTDLAWRLAASRPAVERAVIDLEGRHGLDSAGVARALGLSAMAATARTSAVAESWERELDPILLAFLGPADCAGLGELLSEQGLWRLPPPPVEAAGGPITGELNLSDIASAEDEAEGSTNPTTGELLAAGPVIAQHVEGCEVCADRLRALVGVRALVSQVPLPTPPASVVLEARRARRRLPGAPPPSLDGGARRIPRVAVTIALIVIVLGASTAAGAQVVARRRSQAHRNQRINALTKVPGSGSALSLDPTSLRPETSTVTLRNTRSRPITWRATADVTWVELTPPSGRLDGSGTAPITVRLLQSSPEGPVHATITVTGTDGSVAAVEVTGTVEHPPQVSASIKQCTVSAVTDDAAPKLRLHWRAAQGPEASLTMTLAGDAYQADLPQSPAPLTWWVEATDANGATARTPDRVNDPGVCIPTP